LTNLFISVESTTNGPKCPRYLISGAGHSVRPILRAESLHSTRELVDPILQGWSVTFDPIPG
jgi:hypothetical protein